MFSPEPELEADASGFQNLHAIVNIVISTTMRKATQAGQPPASQKTAGSAPPTLPPR